MRYAAYLWACALCILADLEATAQSTVLKPQDLAVDVVTLKDDTRLRGAVIARRHDGSLVVAVSRTWLKQSQPDFFHDQQQQEIARRQAAYRQLLARIADWIAEPPQDEALLGFLQREAERLQAAVDEGKTERPPDSQLMLLVFAPGRVRALYVQPAARRQVALAAWHEKLPDVERRTSADLTEELRQKNPKLLKQPLLLLDRLAWQGDDPRQWAARRALLEWTYRRPLEFQGTPDLLARTDTDGPAPDITRLVSELLTAELNRQLGADLGLAPAGQKSNASPLQAAAKTAEAENARGMRVTQVTHDLKTGRVTVVSQFYALMPNGRWQPIWTKRAIAETAAQKPDLIARIKQDPQVQRVRTLLAGLGAGAADKQFDRALRFGAAAYEAKDRVDNEFFVVRRLYTERLDGPPLFWPESQK